MSISTHPSKSKRYSVLAILAIVCVAGYGLSEGWFSSGRREVEVEGTKTSVSQPTDQEAASDSSVTETKAEIVNE